MAMTKLENLVDPEVMADMIREKLTDKIRFAPLAKVDTTFVGRPGDKISLPRYSYIGDAGDVAEGDAIPMATLTATSVPVTVKKAGKGVTLTDEAVLGGYGDPLGETANQLTLAIAAKVDNDCLAVLGGIAANMTVTTTGILSGEAVAQALVKFGEEIDGEKVLFIAPQQLAQIRKDPGYLNGSEMATQMMMSGTVGELWGCQLVVSNKIAPAVGGKFTNYIVKPEALAIYLKRDVELETDRDIEHKLTKVTADQHYAAYLLDASKAIKLVVAEAEATA